MSDSASGPAPGIRGADGDSTVTCQIGSPGPPGSEVFGLRRFRGKSRAVGALNRAGPSTSLKRIIVNAVAGALISAADTEGTRFASGKSLTSLEAGPEVLGLTVTKHAQNYYIDDSTLAAPGTPPGPGEAESSGMVHEIPPWLYYVCVVSATEVTRFSQVLGMPGHIACTQFWP
jgi:hypothetical protein